MKRKIRFWGTMILAVIYVILDVIVFVWAACFFDDNRKVGLLLQSFAAIGFLICIFFLLLPAVRCCRAADRLTMMNLITAEEKEAVLDSFLRGNGDQYFADMKEHLEKEYQNQEIINQIRFSVLQNQINPHFLYNTLDSIRGLAYSEGAEQAAQMTNALGAYFRYCISGKEDMVPLEKEINSIKNYFVVQKYRFRDRFRLELEFDENNIEIMRYLVPKLILQPLVENALFHGMERKSGTSTVKIKIRTTSSRLLILVSDDGIGICDEKLKEINQKLHEGTSELLKKDESKSGSGVALSNINQRIKYIYGDNFGINISSTLGLGTDVEVTLPFTTFNEG